MSTAHVVILFLYALGMSIGQVLFKLTADRASNMPDSPFWASILSSGYFYLAVVVYAALTVIWVWILTRVPLSRAYPFVVLAFVITPLFAMVLFGERLDRWYVASLTLIVGGLALLVVKAA